MNQALIDEYIQWSHDTFGDERWLDVLSKLRNEEVWEFRKAVVLDGRTEQADELADCFFLMFKMAHLTGFNLEDIEAAMAKKLIELHNRKYENGKRIKETYGKTFIDLVSDEESKVHEVVRKLKEKKN